MKDIFNDRCAVPMIRGNKSMRYLAYIGVDFVDFYDMDGHYKSIPGLNDIWTEVLPNECILDGYILFLGGELYFNAIDILYFISEDTANYTIDERSRIMKQIIKGTKKIIL